MKTNINNCTYLVAHYEKWLEETAEEALEICKISPELGPPPPTVLPQMTTTDLASRLTTGEAGVDSRSPEDFAVGEGPVFEIL